MSEQRHFKRIPFETIAVLAYAGKSHSCQLLDIALQGALFSSTEGLVLQPGAQCALSICLPSSDLTLEFVGVLIHQRDNHFGFRFIHEDDITMAHLRRLLELNLGDGDQIDRELHRWLED